MEKTIGDLAQEHYMTGGRPTPTPPGRYRIVEDRDLSEVTSNGSIVVRVLDRTVLHTKSVVKWITDTQGYRRDSRESESVWGPGQAFLAFTPVAADEHEKALKAARIATNDAHESLHKAKQKHAEESKELRDKLWEIEPKLESALAAQRNAEACERVAIEQARKMELDLAKVRKEIGEAAWKRIVA